MPPVSLGPALMNERLRIALLLLVSAGVYANALGGGFTLDDGTYIFNGPGVVQPSLRALFEPMPATHLFRPITFATLAANWALGHAEPLGYHLLNLLLHALVVLLLYQLLRLLLDSHPRASNIAFAAALLFAVHPIHTEAVASIVGRSELLAAAFLLAAWLFHLRDLSIPAILCLILALLSKESAVAFLPLVLAGDFARKGFKPLWRYAAITGVTILYIIVLWKEQGSAFSKGASFLDNQLSTLPVHLRILNAIAVDWKYVALQLFPLHLSCDYSFNALSLHTDWPHLFLPAFAAVLLLALWFWTSYKRYAPWFLAGALYLAAFAVTSNILLATGTIFGERLVYLPSVGFCLLVALLWINLYPRQRAVAWAALAALIAVLSARTAVRNLDWRDNLALFTAAVQVVPQSARAHCNLGAEYLARGEFHSAFTELQTSLQIYPDYPDALANFGVLQERLGDNGEARRYLEKAVALTSPGGLDHAVLSVTLAAHLSKVGETDEAFRILTSVINEWPGYAPAWSRRAAIRLQWGAFDAARSDAQTALRLNPLDPQAQRLLSVLGN
jgi:tetratricopeptide (TPR) repeat protein